MEKKESPKKEGSGTPGNAGGLSNRIFAIIKFILGICLLAFVYSSSRAFITEFRVVPAPIRNYFWWGVISFLIVYLFVREPAFLYARGQKILEAIFSFFKPLVKVAPYLLPVYAIILFIAYAVLSYAVKSETLLKYLIFSIGFSIILHLVFSAKTLRAKQGDFLKANYIFGFALIYILNIALLAFCFNFLFGEFSFVGFISQSSRVAKDIFYCAFKQLFL